MSWLMPVCYPVKTVRLYAVSKGFTLIEVLVALVILGCVALGFLASAVYASRQVHEAALRGQALTLARDLIERLNASAMTGGLELSSGSPQREPCSPLTPCSHPPDMLAQDFAESRQLASASLPQGDIAVHMNCGDQGATSCIVVSWQGVRPDPISCLAISAQDATLSSCLILHF